MRLFLISSFRFICLCLVLWSWPVPQTAQAHEVVPSIADFTVNGTDLSIDFRVNAEALVAGINLDGLGNTNDAAEGAVYDDLRFLAPEDLEARFRSFAESWIDEIKVTAGGPVALRIADIEIGPLGDPRVARTSHLVLSGTLPARARVMELHWPIGAGTLVVRQMGVEEPYTGYISGGQSTPPIPLAGGNEASGWQVFVEYIPIGFDHILPKGLDHILFVLGLFFLGTGLRPLVWQVSAFTLAHTATLALGALGWVQIPGAIVEPLIAASIVYVAVENIWLGHLSRWRPVVVFCFGLLHGLGFASVLEEFGLPSGQFLPALIGFNVGVEFGQLTVIALAFLAVGYWFGNKPWYRSLIAIPASAAIALVGAYWFVERVFL